MTTAVETEQELRAQLRRATSAEEVAVIEQKLAVLAKHSE